MSMPPVSSLRTRVSGIWRADAVPALERYVAIPALSPAFDPAWATHGHVGAAVDLLASWARSRTLRNATVEVLQISGRTPVLLIDVPAFGGDSLDSELAPTVLLYGHLDKQPEMVGWRHGLGPWTPVIDGDRLYGRGGADDGYAMFAALIALESLQSCGGTHGRCVVLIEASEESGSPDLAAHVEAIADRLGPVDLVVCLDSGCATYDRLWITTSLRGLAQIHFSVRVLTEGVHSGDAGGVVPSSFRIARALLDRIEDPLTGDIRLPQLHAPVTEAQRQHAARTADIVGPEWAATKFPWAGHTYPAEADTCEHLMARTLRAVLEVTGADGLPPTALAGNVLRPFTTLSLAVRLPPGVDALAATEAIRKALTTDVPNAALVEVRTEHASGWSAPEVSPWLNNALSEAGRAAFGTEPATMGEGGSIPFMGMLAERFPDAQFVVAGVLGPESNAHGPNEFLDLGYAERLVVAVAVLLDRHARERTPSPSRE